MSYITNKMRKQRKILKPEYIFSKEEVEKLFHCVSYCYNGAIRNFSYPELKDLKELQTNLEDLLKGGGKNNE